MTWVVRNNFAWLGNSPEEFVEDRPKYLQTGRVRSSKSDERKTTNSINFGLCEFGPGIS